MDIDVTSLHHRRASHRWDRLSVGDLWERVKWSTPDKPAIIGWAGAYAHAEHERLTYRQADQLANQVANALLAQGLEHGDRVLLFCENSVEAYVTKLAIAKAGLVAAPVNPMLAPDVVAHLIEHVEAKFAVVDAELWPRARMPFEETGLKVGVTITLGGPVVEGSVSFLDFYRGHGVVEPDLEIHADDIWELLFTSGTTALPKGVMVSHAYTYLAGYSFALTLTRGLPHESDLVLASFLPLIYHSGDQIFAPSVFLSGGTLVLGRRPAPEAIATAITRERVTALWAGSPAMVAALAVALESNRLLHDPRSLRVLVYGWSAMPPGTLASMQRMCGQELLAVEIFGQTESITCHRFPVEQFKETYLRTAPEQNYVGLPNPLLASRLVDGLGESLEGQPGIVGEAVYRSPALAAGYYRDEEATREAYRDGWFHSGDSCVYDQNGLRIMVDRLKDIVKSGGENVSSMRVESVLLQHPAVTKVAVVGLPHERWGEAVTAFVVIATGEVTSEDDVLAFARARLAGFEAPKRVVFVDELPETVGGKILKYKLRASHNGLYG